MHRPQLLGFSGAVLVILAGCAPAASVDQPAVPSTSAPTPIPTATQPPAVEVLATGLSAPWSIAFLSDGTPLISERDTGEIIELGVDGSTRTVGVVDDIEPGGEAGLLGLAVDEADRLYAYSTGRGQNRIQRFRLEEGPEGLTLHEAETVIDGLPAARNHNGGRIAFGPDGMLYATVGDAGQRAEAQDLDSLAGKILRMTPDGAAPLNNPFPGSLVYSYGHRNAQGIAWAPDGTMYATEFGQDTWDELNIIDPGANYGWPEVEGAGDDDRYVDPVQQWSPAEASPSGMAIDEEAIYIANLRGERLRVVPLADPADASELHVSEYGRMRDAVRAPDGRIWFLTGNTDGRGDPGPDDDLVVAIR